MYDAAEYGHSLRETRAAGVLERGYQRAGLLVFCALAATSICHAQSTSPPPLFSRTETITYHDNTAKWVLGQVASRTIDGVVAEQTTYDATTALPLQSRSFGKLKQTLTYNADGTVATVKDGNGNVTKLSGWKRGIPQLITFADGKTQSAVVNDNGWVTQVTDENGFATNYGYDTMGRLASTAYPTGDTTTWNTTTQAFVQVAASEYGVPAGHWRQTVRTGAGTKISYFDALWRPLLVREYDNGNVAGTERFVGYEYDHEGRVVFASYPSTVSNPDKGVWTTYDALGRVRSVAQDSEQGLLTTTTSYLNNASGAYTLVTVPGGGQTRTWYQMFDQPSYDAPVKITHPEGAVTTITRDVFGKPTSVVRGNSTGSVQATRTYTYNANQELCRVVEPETGATLMGYDAGGNLKWSSGGWGATAACHATGQTTAILSRTAARTYDARNRLLTLTFPDGRGNQTWTYTADGLPNTVVADNDGSNLITTQYTYNRRRMLTEERMLWNQISWPITYTYNANAHLSAEKYPNGQSVTFAPNALGQPTQAGTFATGVSYYPNGAIKQFTYGNGIVHTMTQNARQLPIRSTDCVVAGCTVAADKRLDLSYGFDKNGNVSQITDNIAGRQNRSMVYDGLDRLTSTTSAMFGTATYAYDVLDNLTRVNVAGGSAARNHFYCYDAKWQLTNVKTGSCSGASVIGLGYDVQGNLNNKNGKVFDFDFGNRLRGVNGVASYVYDAAGRRVRDYTTASKYSLYAQDGRLMYTSDNRSSVSTQYVYLGGSLVGFREVLGTVITPKYQHTDALGSPIAVTGANKAVLENSEYEPYGQVVNATTKDGPGFTGHVLDAATGMNYMQQRYYDPQIGRFLSVDPVTAYSNPVGAFNRYWYANNNPYLFKDPDGRESKFKIPQWLSNILVGRPSENGQRWEQQQVVRESFEGAVNHTVDTAPQAAAEVGGLLLTAAAFTPLVEVALPAKAFASAERIGEMSGMLRSAAIGKGNFGIGIASKSEAVAMGKAWAGANSRVSSNGKAIVSSDGLRQFRYPSEKPNSPHASTGVQANFESRSSVNDRWTNNGHLDVTND